MFEKYYADGVTNLSNPALGAESINTWEAGAERRFGHGLAIAASGYYSRIADLITIVNLTPDVQQYRNVANSRSAGGDFEFKTHPFRDAELAASVSVQNVTNSSLPYQVNSPSTIGKVRFYTPFAGRRLGFAAALGYLSERETVTGNKVRPVWLTDVTVTSNRRFLDMEFAAGVRNLFNYAYSDPVGLEHGTDRLAQNGISFFVKMTWQAREQNLRPRPGQDGDRSENTLVDGHR